MKTLPLRFSVAALLLAAGAARSAWAFSDGRNYGLARIDSIRKIMVNSGQVPAAVTNWMQASASCEMSHAGAFIRQVGQTSASPSPDDSIDGMESLVCPESTRASVQAHAGLSKYRLKWAHVGRGVTQMRPDYALGDRLYAPADLGEVDWAATYLQSKAVAGQESTFFFAVAAGDRSDAALYFARGGNPVMVDWRLKDGTSVKRTYVVQATSSSRPYRLYAADALANASPVSFGDKVVEIIGDAALFQCAYGTNVTVGTDGRATTNESEVVRGVYKSDSDNALYAIGNVNGQFLLAYYDSADKTRVLDVQVIEVCKPSTKIVSVTVGSQLWPMADGYDTAGLKPEVVTSVRSQNDGRGEFIYVHSAQPHEPHYNAAFAIRPTKGDQTDAIDETWNATINWYAPDRLGTSWPFEQTQYSISWGTGVKLLIADEGQPSGQQPIIPDDWSVEVCDYWSPLDHFDGTTWRREGRSLLKVTGENADGFSDVAFVQVDAVYASREKVNTLVRDIGTRLTPSDPSAVCITNDAGRSWLGYIHTPTSALCYDPEDYVCPSADLIAGTTLLTNEADKAKVDMSDLTSVQAPLRSDLFLVNKPEASEANQVLDVWWNVGVRAGDLVGTAYFPSVRECFEPKYPDTDTTEQIVLASMAGSSGTSELYRTSSDGVRERYLRPNEIIMADTLPQVYAASQGERSGEYPGWNPNVAHAYCEAGDGGYVCWALRNDMTAHSSLTNPLVYVKGEVTGEDGLSERRVWTYYVVSTNAAYPKFEGNMLVGQKLPGPHPIDLQTDPWLPEDWWEDPADGDYSKVVAYRDRKGVVWARRDGDMNIHMYYANRSEYAYTYKVNGVPRRWERLVPNGTPVPWNCVLNANEITNTVEAGRWTWHADWPSGSPTMQVARTLTKAADGLAEVWNAASAAVLWPDPDALKNAPVGAEANRNSVIQLVDPTKAQTASLDGGGVGRSDLMGKLGFSCDLGGNALYRDGLWYFRKAPPSVGDRLYYNPNADIKECLALEGRLDEKAGGTSILYVNVLSAAECAALKDLVSADGVEESLKKVWDKAIDSLAKDPVVPTSHRYGRKTTPSGRTYVAFISDYKPRDHYALATLGGGTAGGTNWVAWIENDASPDSGLGVDGGDEISMKVMRIVPEYYLGDSVTRTDSNNLLSQLQDVLYTESFGGKPEDFFFEWQQASPQADGRTPGDGDWRDAGRSGPGAVRFTLGSQGTMADLKNTYYRVRYRANTGTKAGATMGDAWSDWTRPCLAEGWIQRVINAITPFTQRVTDLYENPPENTVSMLQQIGGPYQGDVALNMDNMTEVGLLETYMTLFNSAESMSISMGNDASIDDTGVNKQLLQLVERMNDFYAVLGNEAYSDAANPTIAMGAGTDYSQSMSGLFAFDNQVPTLLDEELSLLRGRGVIEDESYGSDVTAYRESPVFNRLLWNYTRGITAGEVAYAMNYNTTPGAGEIDIQAETAAEEYPQGHGDAWGHYLSGLKLWYRLLRNPSFSWSVSMGEMNVDDHAINVDYFEEEKMVNAAVSLGKTAERIVDLTARKVWRDRAGAVSAADAGYEDKVASRAFGYGEWGNRGGVATFVNWMVAHSLLPAADTNGTDYTDQGLLKINRSTCSGLRDLAQRYTLIQQKVDALNANLNPLGLAENAVPFGLTTAAADGSDSHFEQALEKAKVALRNANALLEKAGESTARLRQLTADEQADADTAEKEEKEFSNRLIAYYGYPYAGDIGVGQTYPQDYDGPDIYHWSYCDVGSQVSSDSSVITISMNSSRDDNDGSPMSLSYSYSQLGLEVKPSSVTGTRRAWGSLQYAYLDYANAVNAYNAAYATYAAIQGSVKEIEDALKVIEAQYWTVYIVQLASGMLGGLKDSKSSDYEDAAYDATARSLLRLGQFFNDQWKQKYDMTSVMYAGKSFVGMASSRSMKATYPTYNGVDNLRSASAAYEKEAENLTKLKKEADTIYKINMGVSIGSLIYSLGWNIYTQIQQWYTTMDNYYSQLNAQGAAVYSAFRAIAPAAEKVLTLKAEAEAILNERQMAREKRARAAARNRYADMAHRLVRDESLDTYADAFGLAQKYAWLAAKAYDYETGGEITAGGGTGAFLDAIIGARMPGETQADGSPMRWGGTGDAGLSDILARLEENWQVQKPRLGINNPQAEMTWFSLRTEAFRILPGSDGLNSWRNRLDSYRVSSLRNVPAYERLCLSVNSDQLDEPAIVIPLATTIDFAKNFFGLDLAGGDSQFASSYFATKIAEAGVELVGYNEGPNGEKVTAFAETPYVFLVPAGSDRLRAPATGEVLTYDIADQLLPVPNLLGSKTLDSDWSDIYQNLLGQTSGNAVEVRRYPPFRANGTANATTLVGRSVWNTEWVLVIPGGWLRGDSAQALEDLIWGNGQTPGIRDIRIGFRTYSHWGK